MGDSELIDELKKSIKNSGMGISDLSSITHKGWARLLQILRRHKSEFADNEWDVIKSGTSLAMKFMMALAEQHNNRSEYNPYSNEICLN